VKQVSGGCNSGSAYCMGRRVEFCGHTHTHERSGEFSRCRVDAVYLLVVLLPGYEKFNLMRQDPCLCFLARCGPPDGKAVLAEQNDDEEMK